MQHPENNFINRRTFSTLAVAGVLTACGGGGSDNAAKAPEIVTQPQDVQVTEEGSATFTIALRDENGMVYQWLRNGSPIAGATQKSFTIALVTLADAGSAFAVRITPATGAAVISRAATLAVQPLPPLQDIDVVAQGQLPKEFILRQVDKNGIIYGFIPCTINNAGAATSGIEIRRYSKTAKNIPFYNGKLGIQIETNQMDYILNSGLDVDSKGNIYYCEINKLKGMGINSYRAEGGRIIKITPDGQSSILLDSKYTDAVHAAPNKIAIDKDDNIVFMDVLSRSFRKIDNQGNVSHIAYFAKPLKEPLTEADLPVRSFLDFKNEFSLSKNGTIYYKPGFFGSPELQDPGYEAGIRKINPDKSDTLASKTPSAFFAIDSTDRIYVSKYPPTQIFRILDDGSEAVVAGKANTPFEQPTVPGSLPGTIGGHATWSVMGKDDRLYIKESSGHYSIAVTKS